MRNSPGTWSATGKLNPTGCGLAEAALLRFIRIANAMGVERLDAYATAAIRDAHDGPAFAAHLEGISGQPITILSGEEEAFWSARGVIGAIPQASGVIGDLGGGSLELARADGEGPGRRGSFPLGVLRLLPLQGRPDRLARQIGTAPPAGQVAETARQAPEPLLRRAAHGAHGRRCT